MPTDSLAAGQIDRTTHAKLLTMAKTANTGEQAWLYLEAAHMVGQSYMQLHLQTHVQMLRLAIHHRNWPEAIGQVFRLLLVPLGHLTGRLPLGNPGPVSYTHLDVYKRQPLRNRGVDRSSVRGPGSKRNQRSARHDTPNGRSSAIGWSMACLLYTSPLPCVAIRFGPLRT